MTKSRFKVHNIINISGKYFYANDKGTSQYHTICDKYINKLFITSAIILAMISASFSVAGLSGFYAIIFVDHRYTLLGMEIPFVDSNIPSGYAILLMYQVFIAFIYLLASITIEVGVILVHNAYELMPALIRLRSDELSAELNSNGQSFNAMMRFRNICLQIRDFNA